MELPLFEFLIDAFLLLNHVAGSRSEHASVDWATDFVEPNLEVVHDRWVESTTLGRLRADQLLKHKVLGLYYLDG